MGLMRDMRELHPKFLPEAAEWLRRCAARTLPVLIVETRRTLLVSDAYYARGRGPIAGVNALYRKAGLPEITDAENLKRITNARAGESYHNWGLALDAIPYVDGKPDWKYDPDNPKDYFDEIADEAKALGLEWGGDWRTFRDMPHIQYPVKLDPVQAMDYYQKTGDWRIAL